jgi:hypothetical protein
MDVVAVLLVVSSIYVAAGALFALAFVSRGVEVIDPAARDASVLVRLLLLPGAVALWPVLLVKWRRA